MADKKVTELTALTAPASGDVLLIIDDVGGTPVSKKITLKALFGAVPANTVFSANVSVTGTTSLNTLKVNDKRTPANSTATEMI